MSEDIVETLRKENLVLIACSVVVLVNSVTVSIGSGPLIAAFGLASVVAFTIGYRRGSVWYEAGHWSPIAVMAAIIAGVPDDSLLEVSLLVIVVGVVDHAFVPLYERAKGIGENALK